MEDGKLGKFKEHMEESKLRLKSPWNEKLIINIFASQISGEKMDY